MNKSLSRGLIYGAILVLLAVTVLLLVRAGFCLPIGGRMSRPIWALVSVSGATFSIVAISRLLQWRAAALPSARFLLAAVGATTVVANAVHLLLGPGSIESRWLEYSAVEQIEIVGGSMLAVACLGFWVALESSGVSAVLEAAPPPRLATKLALCAGGGVALAALLLLGARASSVEAIGQAACNARAAYAKVSSDLRWCERTGCQPEYRAAVEKREADGRMSQARAEKRLADALRGVPTSKQREIRLEIAKRCETE